MVVVVLVVVVVVLVVVVEVVVAGSGKFVIVTGLALRVASNFSNLISTDWNGFKSGAVKTFPFVSGSSSAKT